MFSFVRFSLAGLASPVEGISLGFVVFRKTCLFFLNMTPSTDRWKRQTPEVHIITDLTNLEFIYSFQVLREDSEKIKGGERCQNHYTFVSFRSSVQ